MVSKVKQIEREEKQRQAELKSPDEFQKLGQVAVPWLEQHGRTLFIAVGVVALGGLIAAAVDQIGKRAEATASADLSQALKVLSRPVNVSTTPAADLTASDVPFKSEAEKDEAVVKSLTEFRSKYVGKKAAAAAALPLAQALLRTGKAADVAQLSEEYLKSADANDPMRGSAVEAKGYALEAEKKYDEAATAFGLLSSGAGGDFMKPMGDYHRARMLLLKGDTAGGAKALAELQAASGETSAGRLAKERIALLTAQGVVVPTIAPAAAATLDAGAK